MLSVLSGEAGVGKTYLALSIAAGITAGKSCPAADVLYLTAGNSPRHVPRPRFDALGGDASRVQMMRGFLTGEQRSFQLAGKLPGRSASSAGLSPLQRTTSEAGFGLVILDPLESYLSAESRRATPSSALRGVMDQLAALAEDYHCGILLVRGLPATRSGINAELPSVRSELLAGRDPVDPARRGLVHVRSNCGMLGDSLGYAIEAGEHGIFRWTGKCDLTVESFLSPPPAQELKGIEEAMEMLRRVLAKQPQEATFVMEQAYQDGIPERTLRRAKARLGVVSQHYGSDKHPLWQWFLPKTKAPEAMGGNQGEAQ
jgi:hypothetical protein